MLTIKSKDCYCVLILFRFMLQPRIYLQASTDQPISRLYPIRHTTVTPPLRYRQTPHWHTHIPVPSHPIQATDASQSQWHVKTAAYEATTTSPTHAASPIAPERAPLLRTRVTFLRPIQCEECRIKSTSTSSRVLRLCICWMLYYADNQRKTPMPKETRC